MRHIFLVTLALAALFPARAEAQPTAAPPQPAPRWQGLRPRPPAAPLKPKTVPLPPERPVSKVPAPILDDLPELPPAARPRTRGRAPEPAVEEPPFTETVVPAPSLATPHALAPLEDIEWPDPLRLRPTRQDFAPDPRQQHLVEDFRQAYAPPGPAMTMAELDELLAPATTANQGWFFRGHAGPSYAHIGLAGQERVSIVRGWGAGLGISAGVWLKPQVIATAELYTATHLGVNMVGDAVTEPGGSTTATLLGGGFGVTFVGADHPAGDGYSVSGSLLLMQVRIVEHPSSQLITGTDLAPTLQVGVTREWALVAGWGIGASLRFTAGKAGDDDLGIDATTFGSSFAFSFSYD